MRMRQHGGSPHPFYVLRRRKARTENLIEISACPRRRRGRQRPPQRQRTSTRANSSATALARTLRGCPRSRPATQAAPTPVQRGNQA
eukprot:585619-Pyramimonas_sp.AAC.1